MSWQPGNTLEDVEKDAILKAFQYHNGNKTHTAKSLGISIRTLDAKIERYKNGILHSEAGSHPESNVKISEKQSVPVQKRKEVQKVLPSEDAHGSKGQNT